MFIFYFCGLFLVLISLIPNSSQSVHPKLNEFNPKRSQKIGTKLLIVCSPQEGTKPFHFEWHKNGHLLKGSELNHKIETNQDESWFTISNLKQTDSANYSCSVRNQFGTDSQFTVFTVKGLFNIR